MNKSFKIILTLLLSITILNGGIIWDTTKAVGKGATIYGAKKAWGYYKKHKSKKPLTQNQKKKIFKKNTVNDRTVYQRDIDTKKVIERKNIRTGETITETNAERMKKGMPPYINKNGKNEPIELHHSRQNDKGSLFELSKSTHRIKNKNKGANALHPYGDKNILIIPLQKIGQSLLIKNVKNIGNKEQIIY